MLLQNIPCLINKIGVSKINSLRIKVTNICPFNCSFCHNEGSISSIDLKINHDLFKYLHRFANDLNIEEVHITGGEPSSYPQCSKLVSGLHELGFKVKMTTNGQFSTRFLRTLNPTQLNGINFSIHTLDPKKLAIIQSPPKSIDWGVKAIKRQLKNLQQAKKQNFKVKINTVVQDEAFDAKKLIDFCKQNNIGLRILDDLSPNSSSVKQIIDMLQSIGAEIEQINIIDGTSSYSYNLLIESGFRFSVKSIRKCSLKTMCAVCSIRDQCKEWFYGLRIEQSQNNLMVRLCLHRQDSPAVQIIDDFFRSDQYHEIRNIIKNPEVLSEYR